MEKQIGCSKSAVGRLFTLFYRALWYTEQQQANWAKI
jgi:hypothetical protein